MGSTLPPKEANHFKLIVKAYETKQYKKGLKSADAVLKKFPEHGETLAMRGLLLSCLDRKPEAYELVRRGVKADLRSAVCWHVFGLLHRSDREYREAIKCYRAAIRSDPDNMQILRDLSLLQVQMRDRAGFVETRRHLLTLKPSHRNNWIAFAVAQHLNKDPARAAAILEAFEGTLEEDYPPAAERFEHGELLLYKAQLLEESAGAGRALQELEDKAGKIVDKLSLLEQRAALLVQLGRTAEAEALFWELLERNPDNVRYYEGLHAARGLPWPEREGGAGAHAAALAELYAQLRERFPKAAAAKRLPLDSLEGAEFRDALAVYIQPFLRRGVPSLFSDLQGLYARAGKADLMEEVFQEYEAALEAGGAFPRSDGAAAAEPPSARLWLLFLLAQHHAARGRMAEALQAIDAALEHTPTVTDCYLVKASILAAAGDAPAAAAVADEARRLDLADRFLNSECVRMMLGADQVAEAEATAALFTKDGEQHSSLLDMQCLWYELASGESALRTGRLGPALKMFHAVHKHWCDMVEDQFDFHSYCLRKMTLRAYVRMLEVEERLHAHDFFCRGAQGAVRAYLALVDAPPKSSADADEALLAGLTPAERRKVRAKQRKAAKKEEDAPAPAAAAAAPAGSGGKKKGAAEADPDPDGARLLAAEDPLAEAFKFVQRLQEHSSGDGRTWVLAFEVALRRQKALQALHAVKRARALAPDDPETHSITLRFFHWVDAGVEAGASGAQLGDVVVEVVAVERAEMRDLAEGLGPANAAFLERWAHSLPHRAAAAQMTFLMAPGMREECVALLEESVEHKAAGGVQLAADVGLWTLAECISVHRLLENHFTDPAAADRWKRRCAVRFPWSTHFDGTLSSAVRGLPNRRDEEAVQDSNESGLEHDESSDIKVNGRRN